LRGTTGILHTRHDKCIETPKPIFKSFLIHHYFRIGFSFSIFLRVCYSQFKSAQFSERKITTGTLAAPGLRQLVQLSGRAEGPHFGSCSPCPLIIYHSHCMDGHDYLHIEHGDFPVRWKI
jgi:hypothetical protein